MCLILFAFKSHPRYKLIVAANRDEFYRRKTALAHFWEDNPNILAGRDLEKMGTWMGVTKDGRFAALTNFRNPKQQLDGKRSRGELVAGALEHSGPIKSYMETLHSKDENYPGFNLLAGNLHDLYYYSNVEKKIRRLSPGIFGLSNHLLDTPWPKVEIGKRHLKEIIEGEREFTAESLFSLLRNDDIYPDELLPRTGVPFELERKLSSIFIKTDDYGTRTSTVILGDNEKIQFFERTYADGKIIGERTFQIAYSK